MSLHADRHRRPHHPLRRWHWHRHRYNCYNRVYIYRPIYWDTWPWDDYWFDGRYHTTVIYGWPTLTRTYDRDVNYYDYDVNYYDSAPASSVDDQDAHAVVMPAVGDTYMYDQAVTYEQPPTYEAYDQDSSLYDNSSVFVEPSATGAGTMEGPAGVQADPVVWATAEQEPALTAPIGAESPEDLGLPPGIRQGDVAFASGLYEEARRWYVRAVIADDSDGYAKMLYGYASFAAGDFEVAALAVSRALTLAPDLVENPISLQAMYADEPAQQRHLAMLSDQLHSRESMEDAGELRFLLGYLMFASGEPGKTVTTLEPLVGKAAEKDGRTLADIVYQAAMQQSELADPG